MPLRSIHERVRQTLWFELGGVICVTPLYATLFGADGGQSLLLVLAMSIAAMVWSPLHNTAFDWLDLRLSGRVASDRPHLWRMVHAASHEITVMVATLPILIVLGGHGFWQAVLVDLGFSAFYAGYAYGFHLIYDHLRPVRTAD